jgi:outer membrane protein assembly factor BamB
MFQYRLLTSGLMMFALIATAGAGDWPHWRGPNYDGLSDAAGFKSDWGDRTPPKVWQADIGSGFSGLTIVDGKVYTCGTKDDKQVMFRLDATTGAIDWQTPFEAGYSERQGGDGTRATPAVADGKVYVQGALGDVVCFDVATGKEVWKRTFTAKPQWGYSGSVIVAGDLAITEGDAELVALNVEDGQTRWSVSTGVVGYATPLPFSFEGNRYVVGFMGKEAVIVDIASGKRVFQMPWETSWDVNAATPIYQQGELLIAKATPIGSCHWMPSCAA